MENDPVKSRTISRIDVLLNNWFGRACIIAGTIVIAVCIPLINIGPGGQIDLSSIGYALNPLSWYFFTIGLVYMIDLYFSPGNQGLISVFPSYLIAFLPNLIYFSICIPAILFNKRAVFFVLYTILVIILLINVRGCQLMPKPGML
jgi:hypothetical protein